MSDPRRSKWLAAGLVAAAVLLVAGGWWAASLFQSPAQREADAEAPAAGPVFASVTQGTLARELSFTGEIGPSTQTSITVLPAAGDALSVVTGRAVESGSPVASGHVLTEVNGRPVFLARSQFAFYRDIGYLDSGPDVSALQSTLSALGYAVKVDGQFAQETAQAVASWYRDNGYAAPVRPRGDAPAQDASSSTPSTQGTAELDTPTPLVSEGTDNSASTDEGSTAPVVPVEDPYVPVAELAAMPSETAMVLRGVTVGARVAVDGAADLVLGAADTIVTVSVSPADLGGVAEGDSATISFAGETVEGTVGKVSHRRLRKESHPQVESPPPGINHPQPSRSPSLRRPRSPPRRRQVLPECRFSKRSLSETAYIVPFSQ